MKTRTGISQVTESSVLYSEQGRPSERKTTFTKQNPTSSLRQRKRSKPAPKTGTFTKPNPTSRSKPKAKSKPNPQAATFTSQIRTLTFFRLEVSTLLRKVKANLQFEGSSSSTGLRLLFKLLRKKRTRLRLARPDRQPTLQLTNPRCSKSSKPSSRRKCTSKRLGSAFNILFFSAS